MTNIYNLCLCAYRRVYRTGKRKKHALSMLLPITLTYIVCLALILLTLSYMIPQIINSIIEILNYIPKTCNALTSFLNDLTEKLI